MGGTHEDLLEAVGRLESGVVVSLSVNWRPPTKERSVTVLGERGALVADLLRTDLTFFTNADVPMEWDAMARLKGVSEGDMVRYAFRKPEALLAELEDFRDAALGRAGARRVTIEEGIDVVQVAERIVRRGAG
jgi:UDP-N-acetylglucosamine 3-dehydrogenase